MSASEFSEELRSEYDPLLLDLRQRHEQARSIIRVLKAVGFWRDGGYLLDVGSGSGLKGDVLSENAALGVGCDIRKNLFQHARPQISRLRFVQASAQELPFASDIFDLITCVSVIAELPDHEAALSEMVRCLAPGGGLLFNIANSRLLLPYYRFLALLGRPVPESWIAYASRSARFPRRAAPEGFSVTALRGCDFNDLTPDFIKDRYPPARVFPQFILRWIAALVSPTMVYYWRKRKAGN